MHVIIAIAVVIILIAFLISETDDPLELKNKQKEMQVKVINKSPFQLPEYKTNGSAGMDLQVIVEDEQVVLQPLERKVFPTGLFLEIPIGYESQIRPRSGLAINKGLTVVNSPGTIDADFRGEIMVGLINLSNEDVTIKHGDRVAQMVFAKYEQVKWLQISELSPTERGSGGFGSTGV